MNARLKNDFKLRVKLLARKNLSKQNLVKPNTDKFNSIRDLRQLEINSKQNL